MTPWFQLPMAQIITKELGRKGFREFAIGGAVVFFGLAVPIQASITDADRAESKYYQDFVAKKHGHAHAEKHH